MANAKNQNKKDKTESLRASEESDLRARVSPVVVRRLPRYHRYLGELLRLGIYRISSGELSKMMEVNASQIRQDLNCFGGFGQQGYGYNVKFLYGKIGEVLGTEDGFRAVIVGAGNLGRALAASHMFERRGIERIAMFDVNPDVIGKTVSDLPVLDVSELEAFCEKEKPEIAVLTVPKEAAADVAARLAKAGVRGIWNFANMELKLDDFPDVYVLNVHLGDSLMVLSYGIRSRMK
ncbi:MAG: redox-sensing transcriptional repressor Rex [Clostridia bacterium]|nr:redox-sensing transcriptional repressor Rex [Clostridia bacterium]